MKLDIFIFRKVTETANNEFYHFWLARLSPAPMSLKRKSTLYNLPLLLRADYDLNVLLSHFIFKSPFGKLKN